MEKTTNIFAIILNKRYSEYCLARDQYEHFKQLLIEHDQSFPNEYSKSDINLTKVKFKKAESEYQIACKKLKTTIETFVSSNNNSEGATFDIDFDPKFIDDISTFYEQLMDIYKNLLFVTNKSYALDRESSLTFIDFVSLLKNKKELDFYEAESERLTSLYMLKQNDYLNKKSVLKSCISLFLAASHCKMNKNDTEEFDPFAKQ